MAERAGESFDNIRQDAVKISELVSEMISAFQKNAWGIGHINIGMSEMDKAVQSDAVSAEDMVSFSEKLNSQAENMKVFAGKLMLLTGDRFSNKKKVVPDQFIFLIFTKKTGMETLHNVISAFLVECGFPENCKARETLKYKLVM